MVCNFPIAQRFALIDQADQYTFNSGIPEEFSWIRVDPFRLQSVQLNVPFNIWINNDNDNFCILPELQPNKWGSKFCKQTGGIEKVPE